MGEKCAQPTLRDELAQGARGIASSLLSSRWPEDNLLTTDLSRLYSGEVYESVDVPRLEQVVAALRPALGLEVRSAKMGIVTWDLNCKTARGPAVVTLPRALDAPSAYDRTRTRVPELSAKHMAFYVERGLGRYLASPLAAPRSAAGVPLLVTPSDANYRSVTFGAGRVRLDVPRPKADWIATLGPKLTARALIEIVAAISYHFEPEEDGGTTIADLSINDGDFSLRREEDGSLALRLSHIRRRVGDVSPSRLLLYLCQLAAYEDFDVAGALMGVPTLMSNPALAFAGLVQGLRHRALDQGQDLDRAEEVGRSWIAEFSSAPEGNAYRPWARAFLDGELRPEFGADLRERWWRTTTIVERAARTELEARALSSPEQRDRAQKMRQFLRRIEDETGPRAQPTNLGESIQLNDLSFDELCALFEQVGQSQPEAEVRKWLKRWPYLDFDAMLTEAPGAKRLRKVRPRLDFGTFIKAEHEPLWLEKGPLRPRAEPQGRLANAETFEARLLAEEQIECALRTFPTFESFMDSALQHPEFGYYSRHVQIGRGGHFTTSPERLSPHYGKWICELAYRAFGELLDQGHLGPGDPYSVVEFGAGNGRLAADFLAAARGAHSPSGDDGPRWKAFADALRYRIYERSASLRERQRSLLPSSIVISEGDARTPSAALARDFPDGLRGMVVTNEVPDAFGVHKVLLSPQGEAYAALVLPRVSPTALDLGPSDLKRRIVESQGALKSAVSADPFLFRAAQNEPAKQGYYLAESLFNELLTFWSEKPLRERERLSLELEFGEAYLPAQRIPGFAEHWARNLAAYERSLAHEGSSVVLYPNLHADRFIRELGAHLKAGFVVTIDYGGETASLIHRARRGEFLFRIYYDGAQFRPQVNSPYVRVGLQDLTADVDFSALATSGNEAGLDVVHYGPERDVAAPFLAELLEKSADPNVAQLLGNSAFRVLIQGSRGLRLPLGPLTTPLPLST